MNRLMYWRRVGLFACLSAGLVLGCATKPAAEDTPLQVTKDGLVLKSQTSQRLVYLRPGANFSKYDRVALLDCTIEFQKGWQQTYNQSVVDPNNMVTDQDIQRMKAWLSAEFRREFTTELQNGGYKVVDFGAADVLILRPALTNARVTAPDIMSAGIEMTIIQSAGSATLYLELWDSVSGTLLARVIDAEAAQLPVCTAGELGHQRASGRFGTQELGR